MTTSQGVPDVALGSGKSLPIILHIQGFVESISRHVQLLFMLAQQRLNLKLQALLRTQVLCDVSITHPSFLL